VGDEAKAPEKSRLIGITIFFDPDDPNLRVWYEMSREGIAVGMAMMMVEEGLRQLEEIRRAAAAKQVAASIKKQMADDDLRKSLTINGGIHS
jgi:hypothetical protein